MAKMIKIIVDSKNQVVTCEVIEHLFNLFVTREITFISSALNFRLITVLICSQLFGTFSKIIKRWYAAKQQQQY